MEFLIALIIIILKLVSDRGKEINAKEQAAKINQERERKKNNGT